MACAWRVCWSRAWRSTGTDAAAAAPPAAAATAPTATATTGAVGTSGTAAVPLDPAIRAKLMELRKNLVDFRKASGGADNK